MHYVPKEFIYLDTGLNPIRHIIKRNRLMYLHHLLTRDKSELISKVYFAQLRKPLKDDWATTVMKDCKDLTINPETIKDMRDVKCEGW